MAALFTKFLNSWNSTFKVCCNHSYTLKTSDHVLWRSSEVFWVPSQVCCKTKHTAQVQRVSFSRIVLISLRNTITEQTICCTTAPLYLERILHVTCLCPMCPLWFFLGCLANLLCGREENLVFLLTMREITTTDYWCHCFPALLNTHTHIP